MRTTRRTRSGRLRHGRRYPKAAFPSCPFEIRRPLRMRAREGARDIRARTAQEQYLRIAL